LKSREGRDNEGFTIFMRRSCLKEYAVQVQELINYTDMKKVLLSIFALAAVVAAPVAAMAQTYAYVNTSGEVRTMDADSASQALATAPNLAVHSGVMLIESSSDPVVGDSVGGI
jgi:hypothetical protein